MCRGGGGTACIRSIHYGCALHACRVGASVGIYVFTTILYINTVELDPRGLEGVSVN